jgi:hypothetical protein
MGQQIVPYLGLILYLGVVGFFGWQMLGKGTTGKVGRRAEVISIASPHALAIALWVVWGAHISGGASDRTERRGSGH